MSVLPSIGPTRRRTFTMNVIMFMGLGALALAYLIFVGARPDLVAAWRDKPDDAQTAITETKRTVERALADLDPIKQGVGEMKMDVENMKTGMQEAMERDRILLTKVETLERAATAQATDKVAAAPDAPKKAAAVQPAAKAAAPAKTIETGSIEPPKAAAPAKPAPVGVLLATGPSLELAAPLLADPQRPPRRLDESPAAALRRQRQAGRAHLWPCCRPAGDRRRCQVGVQDDDRQWHRLRGQPVPRQRFLISARKV